MAFFETRSENAVSASLHFSSAQALEKWRGTLPRTGTSNFPRCPTVSDAARYSKPTLALRARKTKLNRSERDTVTVRQTGVTLVELMMTLSMISIVMVLGIPSFQQMMRANRMIAVNNTLFGSLYLSRSHAIKQNVRVTVCKSANGSECAETGGWEQGWIVFTDLDSDGVYDTGVEDLLLVQEELVTDMVMAGDSSVSNYVSYVPRGNTETVDGDIQGGVITTCTKAGTHPGRSLRITPTGRLEVRDRVDCT
jgi:type IV fimbrial biogenesis protein FimT